MRRSAPFAAPLLAAVSVLTYLPALRGGWIWDDDTTLTRNPLLSGWSGLGRIWVPGAAHDYWPVTYSLLWVEQRLGAGAAWGAHGVSLALHATAGWLVWRVLREVKVPGAWFAALLFAVHPLNVESVAWVTQQKGLLALIFSLGAAWAWARGRLGWAWAAFLAAVLSKGSAAVMPLVLAGVACAVGRMDRRERWRLAPLAVVGLLAVAVNVWLQHRGDGAAIRSLSPLQRVLGAAGAFWFYLGKAVWPSGLNFLYGEWKIQAAVAAWWIPLIAAMATSFVLWRTRRTAWGAATGWAWAFVAVALLPVLGLTDVYFMTYAPVADHYAQFALVGVAAWVAWSALKLAGQAGGAAILTTAAAVLAVVSWRHCGMYHDSETLFRGALDRNPKGWMAANNLGNWYADHGRAQEAAEMFRWAVRVKPDDAEAENNLGFELGALKETREAEIHFQRAVELRGAAGYPEAENNWALSRNDAGDVLGAERHARKAVEQRPDYAEAWNNLGLILGEEGRGAEAVTAFRQAIAAQPGFAGAHLNYGSALAAQGDLAGAMKEHRAAVALDPASVEAKANLGVDLARSGDLPAAAEQFRAALRLRPNDPQLRQDLQMATER